MTLLTPKETESACFELKPGPAGAAALLLRGNLDMRSTADLWRQLDSRLRQTPLGTLEVDAAGLARCDGSGLALLHFLSMGGMSPPGARVTVRGMRPEFLALFERFSAQDYLNNRPQPELRLGLVEETGAWAGATLRGLLEQVAFVGELAAGLAANLTEPKRMRWPEVWRVFELAGVDALPIVSLISLLVGLIISFEAAVPFAMFGAQIFIANLLGITMARELAGLITGVVLAGRSGSAFAAELGTMKVNEELDALQTMGLDPVRFLVVQRFVAGVLLTPTLTVYATVVSILGGVLILLAMGFPPVTIYEHMAQTLHCKDLFIGVGKGFLFGALVSGVGCLRGLQTGKGPSAVGDSATQAVVSGILLIIVADAVVAVLVYVLRV